MLAIGNSLANSVWEANIGRQRSKPKPNSPREEKEVWIRSKYEAKEFLATSAASANANAGQQLIEAVIKYIKNSLNTFLTEILINYFVNGYFRSDIKTIVLLLANATSEVANVHVGPRDVRTPLLLACATGNLAIAQLLIWVSTLPYMFCIIL